MDYKGERDTLGDWGSKQAAQVLDTADGFSVLSALQRTFWTLHRSKLQKNDLFNQNRCF
jgi:hypothetical protein